MVASIMTILTKKEIVLIYSDIHNMLIRKMKKIKKEYDIVNLKNLALTWVFVLAMETFSQHNFIWN